MLMDARPAARRECHRRLLIAADDDTTVNNADRGGRGTTSAGSHKFLCMRFQCFSSRSLGSKRNPRLCTRWTKVR